MASSRVKTSLGLSCSMIASFCLITLTILPTQTFAENSASHNFMAQPFGQEITEEVALVSNSFSREVVEVAILPFKSLRMDINVA